MTPRLAAAVKLVEKTGMSQSKAMQLAGYAHSTTRNSQRSQAPGTYAVLQAAQDRYLMKFMKRADIKGLSAHNVADTLGGIVKTGNNLEKIGAISQHLKVILRRSDSMQARVFQSGSITINQNYIIPQRKSINEWNDSAIVTVPVIPALPDPRSIVRAGTETEKSKRLKDLNERNKRHETASHPQPKRKAG